MKVTDQYLEILHKYWGYPDFRGIQKEIIEKAESILRLEEKGIHVAFSNLIDFKRELLNI